ncbi:MAG TPA: hypothetical protein VJ672_00270 [Gemmatimonadaceae bacterium]|nr:hypothetical protein [Gemmatimonadaceae bacterium]
MISRARVHATTVEILAVDLGVDTGRQVPHTRRGMARVRNGALRRAE